jgi:NADP-dependent 3-hydroxy acid dehydrogenase YdfG
MQKNTHVEPEDIAERIYYALTQPEPREQMMSGIMAYRNQ